MNEASDRRTWKDENLAFEAWKHCGAIGGSDKDKMLQIVTWLLGFSAAIIGFQATAPLPDPRMAIFGILVSLVGAFVALLYGSYAAWNWAIADGIARAYRWPELQPDHEPLAGSSGWRSRLIRRLARPCENRIAPVFWVFFAVSLSSAAIHGVLLCCAD